MRALAVAGMVAGVFLLAAAGLGGLAYLNPEARLPEAYRALPEGSPTRREAVLAIRRTGAAQAFLGGVGGALLLLTGAGLWEIRRLREDLERG
ncbi:hypothetical protein [Thermus antranikianii]|uniref:hypothetical protein n=1 Tax=Thermus antranikianii TaxID=88190 RepID=UPI001C769A07|nr:hypothetical protein [Thermus antranikianii]QWK21913.1 MAG: hypothetical protein KNN15_13120 [Thermus antranikianii]